MDIEALLQDLQSLVVPVAVNLAGALVILIIGFWLAKRISNLINKR